MSRFIFALCWLTLTLIPSIHGQGCSDGCDDCSCDIVDDTFTVTCRDYNRTVLPSCMNESTSALFIYNSNIHSLNAGDFENATMLTTIEIVNSSLDHIDEDTFPNMTILKRVSFRGNVIEVINDGVFARTPNLTSLDLSGNKLSQISANTFAELLELRMLDMSDNFITEIEDGSFAGNINLEKLSMNHNSLGLIGQNTFSGLLTLLFFNISNNKVSSIKSGSFPDSPFLEVMDVSVNLLGDGDFPPGILEDKDSLKELYLRGNSFQEVPVATISQTTLLETLDLGGCLISSIATEAFISLVNLKTLYLDDLPVLSSVSDGAFTGLVSLEELILNNNPMLSKLTPASLSDDDLVALKTIHINNNSLTKLSEDLFVNKVSLESVYIHGNPFHCSCDASWMRRQMDNDQYPWIQPWKDGDTAAVCQTPVNFQWVEVYNVSSSDLTCDLATVEQSIELIGDEDTIYEVLLSRGIPSTLWVLPDGGRLLPNKISTTSKQNEIIAEEFVQPNRTVIARLVIYKPTAADNGRYILQATNAGGILNLTFELSLPTAEPPGGLSAGRQAGIAMGVIAGIVLVTLVVVLLRRALKEVPYERIERGNVEAAQGTATAQQGPAYVSFSAADPSLEGQGLSAGQRSYGGTGTTRST